MLGGISYRDTVIARATRKKHEMNLVIVAALIAVCGAAKLDRTYLPPASAKTAGGSPGAIQAPNGIDQTVAPKGSYTNEFQGVVVDAALAGTRASGSEETGLGGPRTSYGSTASKVGDAAFRGAQAGFRFPVSSQDDFEHNSQFGLSNEPEGNRFAATRGSHNFGGDSTPENAQSLGREIPAFEARESRPERRQAAQERAANTLRFDSEVGVETFNYAFETDNGITAEESGIATNGVQAQGGFSYTGDDGKVYSVTYTADEGGYQPRGDHLPTPPPIPEEILKSLEQNARDEANGVVDDGFYDAEKYNEGGDYAESDSVNRKQNGGPSVTAVTGNSDVDASGSFINQNNLPFNPNSQRQRGNDDKKQVNRFQPTSNVANGNFQSNGPSNRFASRNEYLPPLNNQNRPQNARPQVSTASAETPDADSSPSFQQEQSEDGSGSFQVNLQAQSRPGSTSSFASRPTTDNKFNGFKQNAASNVNQFNQKVNRFPSSQGTRQQFVAAPANAAPHNEHNQLLAQPGSSSLNSQHATSVPDTELTTPFESTPHQSNAQPSPPTVTKSFGFNRHSSHPGQSQFGFQNAHPETAQTRAQPTIPSFAQYRPQNVNNRPLGANKNTQSAFSNQAAQTQEQFNQQSQLGNNRPQFSQNSGSQFASSTQKPQLPSQAQDDSYYYNQPSRAFNTPQTQGSRFPSAPSNQFNRVAQRPTLSSQDTEEENYPSTPFPNQNGQRQGSTRYPRPPTYPTESSPSGNQYQSNAVAINGITQATVSSFAAPTSSTGFNRQPIGQQTQQFSFQSGRAPSSLSLSSNKPFGVQTTGKPQLNSNQGFEEQKSETAQPLSQQPLQDVKQPKLDSDVQTITNQQYNGEIYEYNKPAETLPPPESGFGQFGTKVQSSRPTQSRPQFSQSSAIETQKLTSGSSFGSSTNGFAHQSSTSPQNNQFQQQTQLGQTPKVQSEQQTSVPFGSKPMRFGQPAKVSQNDQFSAQTSPQEQATDSQFTAGPSRPQFGNQEKQVSAGQSGNDQFGGQRRPFGSQSQSSFASSTAEVPKPFGAQNGRSSCCKPSDQKQTFGHADAPSQFGGESRFDTQSSFQGNSGLRLDQSQSVAGKGEVFGGPRKPPSFDESGYHY